ncbi:hypothetical protein BB559_002221 [Furculomyces boomerangus]|uniref:Uncharacterized protein n=2 Tax=Harpellales TaxID=61421 RepID=A0A2T9YX29_9FUNG|nr:hypothetical protein BB559_002221 [Furculomyces boomerangus]PWA02358.1 hypothetical protein BB558_001496 [Smittium angustum]
MLVDLIIFFGSLSGFYMFASEYLAQRFIETVDVIEIVKEEKGSKLSLSQLTLDLSQDFHDVYSQEYSHGLENSQTTSVSPNPYNLYARSMFSLTFSQSCNPTVLVENVNLELVRSYTGYYPIFTMLYPAQKPGTYKKYLIYTSYDISNIN